MPPKEAQTLLANPIPNYYFFHSVFKEVSFWESCPHAKGTEGPLGSLQGTGVQWGPGGDWALGVLECIRLCQTPRTNQPKLAFSLPPVINSFPCRAGLFQSFSQAV